MTTLSFSQESFQHSYYDTSEGHGHYHMRFEKEIVQLNDGGYLYAYSKSIGTGQNYIGIRRTNESGEILWHKKIYENSLDDLNLLDVLEVSGTSNHLLVYQKKSDIHESLAYTEISPEGVVLRKNTIRNFKALDATIAPDGTYYAIGGDIDSGCNYIREFVLMNFDINNEDDVVLSTELVYEGLEAVSHHYFTEGSEVAVDADNNILVLFNYSSNYNSSSDNEYKIFYIQSNGVRRLLEIESDSIDVFGELVSVDDGFIYTASSNNEISGNRVIVKLNKNLELQWSRKIGNDDCSYDIRDVKAMEDNGVIVGGGYLDKTVFPYVKKPYLLRVDASGSLLLWDREYKTPITPSDEGVTIAIAPTSSGGYVIMHYESYFPETGGYNLTLIKSNALGESGDPDEVCAEKRDYSTSNNSFQTNIISDEIKTELFITNPQTNSLDLTLSSDILQELPICKKVCKTLLLPEISTKLGYNTICNNNGSLILSTNNGYNSYTWFPSGTENQSLTVREPGTYTVVVTDENGCTGQASFVVDEIDISNINIELSDTVVCEGQTTTFTVNNPDQIEANYSWAINNVNVGTGESYTITNTLVNTTIELTTTSLDGSCSYTTDETVNVVPAPDPSFTYEVSCKGVTNKTISVTPNQTSGGSMWFIYASNLSQEVGQPLDPNGDTDVPPNSNTHWAYDTEFTNLDGQCFIIVHGVWNSECSWTTSSQWINLEEELSLDPGMSTPVISQDVDGYRIQATANNNPERDPSHWWQIFKADGNCNLLTPIAPVSSIVNEPVFDKVIDLRPGCYIIKHGVWEEGCSAWQEVTSCFCISKGRNSLDDESVFSMYPNPTTDKAFIEFKNEQNGHIEIRDMLGNLLKRKLILNQKNYTISLKEYKPGVYYIIFFGEHYKSSKKIIKY